MLNISPEVHNPRIKHILKTFKKSAAYSLECDPSNTDSINQIESKNCLQPNKTINSMKRQISNVPNLKNKCGLKHVTDKTILETIIEGQKIASFLVAGEPRLCVPHFLSNLFCGDFSEKELVDTCEKLQIQLHPASSKQLAILKSCTYLLPDVDRCSLITRSDAERLCGAMLHRPHQIKPINSVDGIKICHECFGGCEGILNPYLYKKATSACIQCHDCCAMLTPMQFVCHSHRCDLETRTYHWGFESTQWRYYIFLSTDHWHQKGCQKILDEVKMKFTIQEEQMFLIDEEYEPREKCLRDTSEIHPNADFTDSDNIEANHWKDWKAVNNEIASKLAMKILQQTINERKKCVIKIPEYLYLEKPVLLDNDFAVQSTRLEFEQFYVPNITLLQEPYHQLRHLYEAKNTAESDANDEICKFSFNNNVNDDDDDDDDDDESWQRNDDNKLIVASEEVVVSSNTSCNSNDMTTMQEWMNKVMLQRYFTEEEKLQFFDTFVKMQRKQRDKIRNLEIDNYELRQKLKDMSSKLGKKAVEQYELAISKNVIQIDKFRSHTNKTF